MAKLNPEILVLIQAATPPAATAAAVPTPPALQRLPSFRVLVRVARIPHRKAAALAECQLVLDDRGAGDVSRRNLMLRMLPKPFTEADGSLPTRAVS